MAGYVLSGKAVRALTKIVRGTSKTTTTDYLSAPVSYDGYTAPYTVRWSQMENSGSGAWVIWLPDITKLVMYDKSYITPSGVTAATELVAGWYTINDVAASDTAVWLNLHIPDSDSGSSVTASFSNSADTATTGESVAAILVAQMSTDATEGYKLVKQLVDSAILLGGGSDGGGGLSGTVEFVADVDWYVNGSIHQIIKRLRVLNLATGVVTDKAGTTYNNGWEVAANTTPISSIIGS